VRRSAWAGGRSRRRRRCRPRSPPCTSAGRPTTAFWFDHEYGPYPEHEIDLAALRRHAERLGTAVTEMPGGHIGYLEDPPGFAAALEDALTPRS
jgi:hypothetical protein